MLIKQDYKCNIFFRKNIYILIPLKNYVVLNYCLAKLVLESHQETLKQVQGDRIIKNYTNLIIPFYIYAIKSIVYHFLPNPLYPSIAKTQSTCG